jgi:hypothetical protein
MKIVSDQLLEVKDGYEQPTPIEGALAAVA